MPTHVKIEYGSFEPGWKVIPSFPDYEANEMSLIRNKKTKKIIMPNRDYQVGLMLNGKRHMKKIYHLSLTAFFPHITPMKTGDHIDENHTNHYIGNLQWMTLEDNSFKSNQLKPRNSAPAQSKPILQWTLDGKLVCEFKSSREASRQTKISQRHISECACNKCPTAGGFKWTWKPLPSQEDLLGEQWGTSDQLKKIFKEKNLSEKNINKIRISNLGRVLTTKGIKTKGKTGRLKVYRSFHDIKIHILVWAVWGNRVPGMINGKPEFILHDDKIPPDEDGCCSNAIQHLRLGTQSENVIESHTCGNLGRIKSLKRTFQEMK